METEIDKTVKKSGQKLLELKISRTTKGVSLFIQSEIFGEFFHQLYSPVKITSLGRLYDLPESCDLGGNRNRLLIVEGAINPQILSLVEISSGTTIEFDGAWSSAILRDASQNFKKLAVTFYNDYIRKFDIKMTITTIENI